MRLTVPQLFLLILCLLAAGFLDFYLGARFGPEMFWGIKVDKNNPISLLPNDVSDQELESLLKDGATKITFHEVLQDKPVTNPPALQMPETVSQDNKKHEDKPTDTATSQSNTSKPPSDQTAHQPVVLVDKPALTAEKPTAVQETKPSSSSKPEPTTSPSVATTSTAKKPTSVEPSSSKKIGVSTSAAQVSATQVPEVQVPATQVSATQVSGKQASATSTPVVNPSASSGGEAENDKLHSGSYTLQMGSFSDPEKAKKVLAQYPGAYLKETELPGKGKWYKVYVGHYEGLEAASVAQNGMYQKYKILPVVVKTGP